jgi:Kef-type K+ transport system membrane component KefB
VFAGLLLALLALLTRPAVAQDAATDALDAAVLDAAPVDAAIGDADASRLDALAPDAPAPLAATADAAAAGSVDAARDAAVRPPDAAPSASPSAVPLVAFPPAVSLTVLKRNVPPAPPAPAALPEAAVELPDAVPSLDAAAEDVPAYEPAPEPPPAPSPPPAPRARPSASSVARVVLGLFALLALAIVAGHPAVRAFERRAGLGMFAATGIPFLALGAIARLPSVGILTDAVVRDLRPVLEFGLGWIGFRVGTEFDVRETDRLPAGTGRLLAAESAAAFLAVGLGSAAFLALLGAPLHGGGFLRDGLVLGACAAVSAPSGARALEAAGLLDEGRSRLLRRIAMLDDAMPIVVLALVTALFRPVDGGHWHLPPLGWVFLQVGMGAALGMLTVALVRSARSANEDVALTLGAIAFASGMAGYLGFSPMVVGCVAGIIVANLTTGRGAGAFATQLRTLERPIYMAFFAIAGALWEVHDWRGWAIVPVFVLARLFGKRLGVRAALAAERLERAPSLPPDGSAESAESASVPPLAGLADPRLFGIALIPTSAVSIAVIISARQAYPDSIAPYLETVVIVGAIAAELVLQFSVPKVQRPLPPSEPPSEPPALPGASS